MEGRPAFIEFLCENFSGECHFQDVSFSLPWSSNISDISAALSAGGDARESVPQGLHRSPSSLSSFHHVSTPCTCFLVLPPGSLSRSRARAPLSRLTSFPRHLGTGFALAQDLRRSPAFAGCHLYSAGSAVSLLIYSVGMDI